MRGIGTLLVLAEAVSLICALVAGLIGAGRGVTARSADGEEMVFRRRGWCAVYGMSLFLFLAIFALVLLLGGSEPPETAITAFLFFGGISAGPLLLSAPEELRIDAGRRTYRWRKGWIWRHPRAGSLDDMAGICATHKHVLLVLKKRGFNGSVLLVGSVGDKSAATAEDLADLLDLPVIPAPWQRQPV